MKHRKQIIENPVAAMRKCLPDADPRILDALDKLASDRAELAASRDRTREQAGIVSGKIGAAKATGDPVEQLIRSMRDHSNRLKDLDSRISDIDLSILGYFDSQEPGTDKGTGKQVKDTEDRYRYDAHFSLPVTVSLLKDETSEWNDYVRRHPASTIYHLAEWREFISTTFGHEGHYITARDKDSRIVGVLPLVRLRSLLFGDFFISMPYFNYGGALGDSLDIEQTMIESAIELSKRLGVSHIELRDEIRRDGFPVRDEKVNMILALPEDETSLWQSFPSKLRSQVRRAQRENPAIHSGGSELLDDFYSVFTRNMRDLGTPVYDRQFFLNILNTFPAESRILVVTLNEKPVAAGFLIGYKDKMEIPWASTIRDVNRLSINMFLYWEALKYSISGGHRYFDFGRSTIGVGTYRFKQQWGARPVQLYWHYWLSASGKLPSLSPSNPKFALFIRLWKMLPVAVTKLIGPMIVKNLP